MPVTINGTTGITSTEIADNAITEAKIAPAAVSGAKVKGAQVGAAPIYGCRAWVNFDGTRDSTGAVSAANTNRFIRASGNVASVLRTALGTYRVTFTTAMPDDGFAGIVTGKNTGVSGAYYSGTMIPNGQTATYIDCIFTGTAGNASENGQMADCADVYVAVFR